MLTDCPLLTHIIAMHLCSSYLANSFMLVLLHYCHEYLSFIGVAWRGAATPFNCAILCCVMKKVLILEPWVFIQKVFIHGYYKRRKQRDESCKLWDVQFVPAWHNVCVDAYAWVCIHVSMLECMFRYCKLVFLCACKKHMFLFLLLQNKIPTFPPAFGCLMWGQAGGPLGCCEKWHTRIINQTRRRSG